MRKAKALTPGRQGPHAAMLEPPGGGLIRGLRMRSVGFLWGALFGFVTLLLLRELFKASWRRAKRRPRKRRRISRADPQPVAASIYRRPDPLIYSQFYLMAHGLAVTWDNPDIRVERKGTPVDSHALKPSTEYEIVARIWNSSTNAPVAGLPVHFSYLSFGIGGGPSPIGETTVDLGVKGSPSCPAFARYTWMTPKVAGHYCIQVEVEWFDDSNPANNLGQHNINVKALNSPRASFQVPLFNRTAKRRGLAFRADSYSLPPLPECDQQPQPGNTGRERFAALARSHGYEQQRPPEGWEVLIEPRRIELDPAGTGEVNVSILAPDGFAGRQAVNVNAFDGKSLLGGITLYAISPGDK